MSLGILITLRWLFFKKQKTGKTFDLPHEKKDTIIDNYSLIWSRRIDRRSLARPMRAKSFLCPLFQDGPTNMCSLNINSFHLLTSFWSPRLLIPRFLSPNLHVYRIFVILSLTFLCRCKFPLYTELKPDFSPVNLPMSFWLLVRPGELSKAVKQLLMEQPQYTFQEELFKAWGMHTINGWIPFLFSSSPSICWIGANKWSLRFFQTSPYLSGHPSMTVLSQFQKRKHNRSWQKP